MLTYTCYLFIHDEKDKEQGYYDHYWYFILRTKKNNNNNNDGVDDDQIKKKKRKKRRKIISHFINLNSKYLAMEIKQKYHIDFRRGRQRENTLLFKCHVIILLQT